MATRQKRTTVIPPLNAKEADIIMSIYASDNARIDEINAIINKEIIAIHDKYTEELTLKKEALKINFQRMQMYAETHPELFTSKKSVDTPYGILGFRTGTPKLKTLRGYTFASVLKLLKTKDQQEYIRTKADVAKDLFIANRNDEATKSLMQEIGLYVTQDDTFYIDLNKEELYQ